jgi:hypothetical protein
MKFVLPIEELSGLGGRVFAAGTRRTFCILSREKELVSERGSEEGRESTKRERGK